MMIEPPLVSPNFRYWAHFVFNGPQFPATDFNFPSLSFPSSFHCRKMGMKCLHWSCSVSLSFRSSSCLPDIAKTARRNLVPLVHNLNLRVTIGRWVVIVQCCSCISYLTTPAGPQFCQTLKPKSCAHLRSWGPSS